MATMNSNHIELARHKMQIGDLSAHDKNAENWWDNQKYYLRMLSNQVRARMIYFDRIDRRWEGLNTLDLGCGGGYMAEALASRGAHVIAIDPWISVLEIARKHAEKSKLDILYLAGAGESLPFENNSIDRVVSVDVLEHVIDLKTVLSEIHRVLLPGGIFFFDTINRTWFSRMLVVSLLEDVLRILPRGTHEPDKFIRPVELKAELESLGFRVAPMVGMGPVRFNHCLEPVFGLLPSTAIMYLGHAIK